MGLCGGAGGGRVICPWEKFKERAMDNVGKNKLNKFNLLSLYYASGTMISGFHRLHNLILPRAFRGQHMNIPILQIRKPYLILG